MSFSERPGGTRVVTGEWFRFRLTDASRTDTRQPKTWTRTPRRARAAGTVPGGMKRAGSPQTPPACYPSSTSAGAITRAPDSLPV